jgi:hypothetical protein
MFLGVSRYHYYQPRFSVWPYVFVNTIVATIAETNQIPISIRAIVGSKNNVMAVEITTPATTPALPAISSEDILL